MAEGAVTPERRAEAALQWRSRGRMTRHRIYSVSVASVYPHYVAKAEKKGRTKAEVDEIARWLTGYSQEALEDHLAKKTSFEDFFAHAPRPSPSRALITGTICGIRVEEIQEPIMREIAIWTNWSTNSPRDDLWRGSCGSNRTCSSSAGWRGPMRNAAVPGAENGDAGAKWSYSPDARRG
jgi:hypothetical protein